MSLFNQPEENLQVALNKYLATVRDRLEKQSGNIHEIEAQRKKLESDLKLGERLYEFMERIHFFCAWDDNARKKNGGRIWRNRVVTRDQAKCTKITRDHSEYNRPYDKTDPKLSQPHPVTVYEFDCEQVPHRAVYYEDSETGFTPDETFSYRLVEVYKGDKVAFLAHCSEIEGEYGPIGKSAYMVAFIPGPWVNFLLEKCKQLEIEEKEWAIKDEYDSSKTEQLRRNFLD